MKVTSTPSTAGTVPSAQKAEAALPDLLDGMR
jgi:hypothetical protein